MNKFNIEPILFPGLKTADKNSYGGTCEQVETVRSRVICDDSFRRDSGLPPKNEQESGK